MTYLYLILLIISPQLWWQPILGFRVDYVLYPLWFLVVISKKRTSSIFSFSKIEIIFILMIVWLSISVLLNQKNTYSTQVIIDYIKYFLIFIFLKSSTLDFKSFKRIILFLVFLVFVLVFESIEHKMSVDGLGWVGQTLAWADDSVIKLTGSGRTRWINIFDGPGVFCVLFTIAFPFVLQHLDKHYVKFVKLISLVALLFLSVAIYYTGSRGGFLATLVCLFAYIISRRKMSFRQLVVASSISFLLFMMVPAFLTSTRDSNGSAQHRVDMWEEGLEMTKYNPIFGIGKKNFANYTGTLIAHNSAIEVMGETGLPGFFLWLSLIVLSFKSIRAFFLSTDNLNEKSYSIALAISIIGYIASSMFVTLEYETFYFLLGLAAVLGNLSGHSVEFTKKDFTLVVGIMFGWIVLLKLFFFIY